MNKREDVFILFASKEHKSNAWHTNLLHKVDYKSMKVSKLLSQVSL